MGINFRPVDKDNWLDCVNLEVTEEQNDFVTNNTFSVLQSHYDDRNYPVAIYDDNTMVGFLMYLYDEDFKAHRLRRFMIDKDYQRNGYGKLALLKLKELIKNKYDGDKLYTSVKPQNNVTKCLYERVGFKETGEIRWGEEILKVDLCGELKGGFRMAYEVGNYEFRRISNDDVDDMLTWKYKGVYSFFDNDLSQGKINYIKNLPLDENAYSIYNKENELIGNCNLYFNDKVTFSIQMRPSLTSQGRGKEFLEAFLSFAKEKYKLLTIGLSVLKFNERAIRLYNNLDFKVTGEFIGKTVQGDMEFISMEKGL